MLALVALASCGPAPMGNSNAEATNVSQSTSAVASSQATPAPKFVSIAKDTYAMTFAPGTPHPVVETAMREHCAGRQWCKVIGWDDPAFAATAMPMTDREADAVKVNYTVNRASGMDEAAWS